MASNIQKQSSKPSQSSGGGNNGGSTSGGGGNTSGSGNNNKSNPNILTLHNNIEEAKKRSVNTNNPIINMNHAIWFYNKVRPKGDWDYKVQNPEDESFGNINFGATGGAQGWDLYWLHQGAGGVQKVQQQGDRVMNMIDSKHGVRESEGHIFNVPPYWDQKRDYLDVRTGYEMRNW